MNVSSFSFFLHKPENIQASNLHELEKLIEEFPYFQAARVIHLKALKEENSFKYNAALKKTAAYTADRSVLFDFITSEVFGQHTVADNITRINSTLEILDIAVEEEEEVIVRDSKTAFDFNKVDAAAVMDPELFEPKDPPVKKEAPQTDQEKLNLGKPLEFDQNEKHSFSEWLKLSGKLKAIDRPELKTAPKQIKKEELPEPQESITPPPPEKAEVKTPREKRPKGSSLEDKLKLIDRFIENNPKIAPPKENSPKMNLAKQPKIEKTELMTETLARVYLEQKKYKKAIQAYKILSLKYPEKSGFFADQIKAIANLKESK